MTEITTRPKPEKILIIRLSSIGDIVLTTPVIRLLKQKYPASKIDFVIKKEFAEILIDHPDINRLWIYDSAQPSTKLRSVKKEIGSENYDLVVDLHKNFRSYYLTMWNNAGRVIRYKKSVIRRVLFVHLKLNFYQRIFPVYLRYIDCLRSLEIFDDRKGHDLFFSNEIKEKLKNKYQFFLTTPGMPIIGIAPGAHHATKRWLPEHFASVIDYLTREKKSKVIIFGGKGDRPVVNLIDRDNTPPVLNTTGELSLLESAAMINYCDLFLTNDSGLMHLASALKKKVVALFGSTTEEFGFFPYTTEHIVIQNRNLKCRPCSHVGKKQCPKKHFKCMKEITVEQVVRGIEKLFDK
jgi:lipopolysaccharide heptosyltransferase II